MAARWSQPSQGALPELPPISALFLIDFDVKAGYTIVWKEAIPGLELEGLVEYKSLPSGLHTVSDDLIYFVHEEGHAGLSAFINAPTDDEEARHARMIAVGVLVPLSYGRLGKAWRHAEGLKDMAARLASDREQTQLLQEYWDKCGARDSGRQFDHIAISDSPLASPALSFAKIRPNQWGGEHARNRSVSEGAALMPPGHRLSPFHPAWSLAKLLDTFGPLIFPIHRAALLRKRILISAHAPVHEVCNFGKLSPVTKLYPVVCADETKYMTFPSSPTYPSPYLIFSTLQRLPKGYVPSSPLVYTTSPSSWPTTPIRPLPNAPGQLLNSIPHRWATPAPDGSHAQLTVSWP